MGIVIVVHSPIIVKEIIVITSSSIVELLESSVILTLFREVIAPTPKWYGITHTYMSPKKKKKEFSFEYQRIKWKLTEIKNINSNLGFDINLLFTNIYSILYFYMKYLIVN